MNYDLCNCCWKTNLFGFVFQQVYGSGEWWWYIEQAHSVTCCTIFLLFFIHPANRILFLSNFIHSFIRHQGIDVSGAFSLPRSTIPRHHIHSFLHTGKITNYGLLWRLNVIWYCETFAHLKLRGSYLYLTETETGAFEMCRAVVSGWSGGFDGVSWILEGSWHEFNTW